MGLKRYFVIVIVFISSLSTAFSTDVEPPIFKVTIENDNLFVCLNMEPPWDVSSITLKLKGGKKNVIRPVSGKNCKTLFYLDSWHAQLIKVKGVKSIIYNCVSSSKKVEVDQNQNRLLISYLP